MSLLVVVFQWHGPLLPQGEGEGGLVNSDQAAANGSLRFGDSSRNSSLGLRVELALHGERGVK